MNKREQALSGGLVASKPRSFPGASSHSESHYSDQKSHVHVLLLAPSTLRARSQSRRPGPELVPPLPVPASGRPCSRVKGHIVSTHQSAPGPGKGANQGSGLGVLGSVSRAPQRAERGSWTPSAPGQELPSRDSHQHPQTRQGFPGRQESASLRPRSDGHRLSKEAGRGKTRSQRGQGREERQFPMADTKLLVQPQEGRGLQRGKAPRTCAPETAPAAAHLSPQGNLRSSA